MSESKPTKGKASKVDQTSDFHRIPRVSASMLQRVHECSSTFAREQEVFDFCQAEGIEPPDDSSPEGKRGTQLHKLLSQIPFTRKGAERRVAEWEEFDRDLWNEIGKIGDKDKLYVNLDEQWFCYHAIRMRDRAVVMAIREAEKFSKSRATKITCNLDAGRLKTRIGKYEFSGLPDVLVQIETVKGRWVIILDYKSGYQEAIPVERNLQVKGLSFLANRVQKADHVFVGLIEQAWMAKRDFKTKLAYYNAASLAQGVSIEALVKGAYAIKGASSEQLDGFAKVGDHCGNCRGKAACQKLHQVLKETTDKAAKHQNEINKVIAKGENVNRADFSKSLIIADEVKSKSKLINDLKSDLDDLARKLVAKHVFGEDQIDLKPGRDVLAFKPDFPDKLKAPTEVYKAIKSLAEGAGRVVPDESHFTYSCANITPSNVRKYLAQQWGMTEKEVAQVLLAEGGPFSMRTDASTVEIKSEFKKAVLSGNLPEPVAHVEDSQKV